MYVVFASNWLWLLKMRTQTSVILLAVWCSTMTSYAMKSGKYVTLTNATGTQVCSTDTPSQVLTMSFGEEMECGMQCLMSSCPYHQLKSSNPIQCELYNQFPINFKSIDNCIGYRSSAISKDLNTNA